MGRALWIGGAAAIFLVFTLVYAMLGPPLMPWQTLTVSSPVGWDQLKLVPWLIVVGASAFTVWIPCALLALAAVKRIKPFQMRFDRGGVGACEGCGYDLRGVRSGACPECGLLIAPAPWPESLGKRERRQLAWIAMALSAPFVLGVIGVAHAYGEARLSQWLAVASLILLAAYGWWGVRLGAEAAQRRLRAKTKDRRAAARLKRNAR